jgi:hypothetical protein
MIALQSDRSGLMKACDNRLYLPFHHRAPLKKRRRYPRFRSSEDFSKTAEIVTTIPSEEPVEAERRQKKRANTHKAFENQISHTGAVVIGSKSSQFGTEDIPPSGVGVL